MAASDFVFCSSCAVCAGESCGQRGRTGEAGGRRAARGFGEGCARGPAPRVEEQRPGSARAVKAPCGSGKRSGSGGGRSARLCVALAPLLPISSYSLVSAAVTSLAAAPKLTSWEGSRS